MTTFEAIRYFGTQVALASALKCRQSSVSEWGEYPPAARQFQLERLTNGALKAEPDPFKRRTPAEAAQ